jgi:AcrR family transcriptional regulator
VGSGGVGTGVSVSRRPRRNPAEIRDRIIEAAIEEFEASGFAGATTAAIARRAEVTETQIFRYFDSKAALFRTAIFVPLNRHFTDFLARQVSESGPLRDRTRSYITELQDFIASHSRMLMSLVVAQAYDSPATEGVEGLDGLAAYFERGAATMRSRVGAPADGLRVSPELMVRVSFAAVLGCALFGEWMMPEGLASPDAVRDAVIDFVIDGLNANERAE